MEDQSLNQPQSIQRLATAYKLYGAYGGGSDHY